jgi:hypothetical protein
VSIAPRNYSDSLPGTWLAERLAVDPLKVEAMRRDGELIAIWDEALGDWRYPPWQFEDWKPRRGIARIVAAAREAGIDDSRLYELMTARMGLTGGGGRLADLLVEGREDEVVEAVRSG